MSDSPTDHATETVGDIVAVASGNESFSTLVAAVGAAGLVETLQGAGPFTVFAPTNEAFAALPARKATGPDGIPAELLRAGGPPVALALHGIISKQRSNTERMRVEIRAIVEDVLLSSPSNSESSSERKQGSSQLGVGGETLSR